MPLASPPAPRVSLSPFLSLLVSGLLVAAPAHAASSPVDAPVTAVTVYSDQARVTRTARVTLTGTQAVELPPLLDTVETASLRVDADNAEVVRIDIAPLNEDQLPVDEARRALTELERLDDELAKLRGTRAAVQAQAELVRRLQPSAPDSEPLKPAPRLAPAGWPSGLAFLTEQLGSLQTRLRVLDEELRNVGEQRAVAADKAQLLGARGRRSGWKVTPVLSGNGPATVRLTYRARNARWYPVYDLQLDPATSQVQLSFAALVSQETGEDWTDAALTVSSAVPSTAVEAPKLRAWRLGEKERFIPTPPPLLVQVRPAPPAQPLLPEPDESEWLRQRLLARATGAVSDASMVTGALGSAEQLRRNEAPSPKRTKQKSYAPPPPPPAPAPSRGYAAGAPAVAPSMPRAVDDGSSDFDSPVMLEEEALSGDLAQPEASEMVSRSRAPQKPRPGQPTSPMSLTPPPSYRPPRYAPDLPVSLAGGHDLTFTSLRTESVPSGAGSRRVALLSERWPVSVERKLFPGVTQDAFLVADIKSPSKQVLPAGKAQLFVGDDPAGSAQLGLVAPGESFTLPLGLDRALRPVRNVKLVTSETGMIGKDEVNQYIVTIELANPYPRAIPVRVFDQWPVTDDSNLEVKLVETKPTAIQDKLQGTLEWRVTLPASGKSELSFTYTLKRPKGWRLHQR